MRSGQSAMAISHTHKIVIMTGKNNAAVRFDFN